MTIHEAFIRNRVERFFNQRSKLAGTIGFLQDQFDKFHIKAIVLGGALRNTITNIPIRDLDIVVLKGDLPCLVNYLINNTPWYFGINNFGGHRIVNEFISIDIWNLHDTWAIRERHVDNSLEGLLSSPFLNIDSIAADICAFDEERNIYMHNNAFIDGMNSKKIDILFEPNPDPLKCCIRTYRMAQLFDLNHTPKVRDYIIKHLKNASEEDILKKQSIDPNPVSLYTLNQWCKDCCN